MTFRISSNNGPVLDGARFDAPGTTADLGTRQRQLSELLSCTVQSGAAVILGLARQRS